MSQGSLQSNRSVAASNVGTGAGSNSNRASPAAQSTGPSAGAAVAAQSAQLAAAALGRVDHSAQLAENIGSLYDANELSDVTLVLSLDGTEFALHRVILAARSQYFRALLYGGMRESSSAKIELQDATAPSFRHLIQYMYTGRISLADMSDLSLQLDVLGLAHQYGFVELESAVCDYLRASLTSSNVCLVFDAAYLYSLDELLVACFDFLDRHAEELLRSDPLLNLAPDALLALLSRDSFCAAEVDIFRMMQRWIEYNRTSSSISAANNSIATDSSSGGNPSFPVVTLNEGAAANASAPSSEPSSSTTLSVSSAAAIGGGAQRRVSSQPTSASESASSSAFAPSSSLRPEQVDRLLGAVRLHLMSVHELLTLVRPTGLFSGERLLDAIQVKDERRDTELNYRGVLLPEENVASQRHGAQVIRGELKNGLLDGESQLLDADRSFTRHPIDDPGQGIVVKLGVPAIINTVRLLLWDRDARSYSYYVEVSMDERDWVRVVDYRAYLCRSWQTLHFAERVVRFIRLVGTLNTANRVFHVISLEALFTRKSFQLKNDVIVPRENVATVPLGASVIDGVSRTRNALINGNTTDYDWDSGYTCHQLGHGSIVVQLAQPYYIESMRLLLWDCDDRAYSYMIETSVDNQRYTLVADRRNAPCKSWQVIPLSEPRVVVFVRITGTRNTANEVFHCVHFECPADPQAIAALQSGAPENATTSPNNSHSSSAATASITTLSNSAAASRTSGASNSANESAGSQRNSPAPPANSRTTSSSTLVTGATSQPSASAMLSTESSTSNITVAHRVRSHSGQSDLEADERLERSANLAGTAAAARTSASNYSSQALHSYATAGSSLNGVSYRGGQRWRHAVSSTAVGSSTARVHGVARTSSSYIPYEADAMMDDFAPIGAHLEDEQDGASFGQRYNASTAAGAHASSGTGAAPAAAAAAAGASAAENPATENPPQPPPRPPPMRNRDPAYGALDPSLFEANFHMDPSPTNQSPSNEMFFVPGEGGNSEDGVANGGPAPRLAPRFSASDDD